MKPEDLLIKLCDLYAGDELPIELAEALETAALNNVELASEMQNLRMTVQQIRSLPRPELTEESFQRILMRLYANGMANDEQGLPSDQTGKQYYLPISG